MRKGLKRSLAALCAAVLLLAACPAAMAANALEISFDSPTTLAPGKSAPITTKINAVKDGTIVYSLTDVKQKTVVYTETRTDVKAGQEIVWPAVYDINGLDAKNTTKIMRASFVLDGKTYHKNLYYIYPTGKNAGDDITIETETWFPNNTACTFGIAFRDIKPSLTDKWYNFTPVDLTVQGRQTFEYIASNMYVIGEVYVDVEEDSVTVSYRNFYGDRHGNTETKDEFFTFFSDLASVRYTEPQDLRKQAYSFGVPLSIEKDLQGDTSVLLFVRNKVTYCNYVLDAKKLTRFWPNSTERKAQREVLMEMMDK